MLSQEILVCKDWFEPEEENNCWRVRDVFGSKFLLGFSTFSSCSLPPKSSYHNPHNRSVFSLKSSKAHQIQDRANINTLDATILIATFYALFEMGKDQISRMAVLWQFQFLVKSKSAIHEDWQFQIHLRWQFKIHSRWQFKIHSVWQFRNQAY